jgi:hypothetical protein
MIGRKPLIAGGLGRPPNPVPLQIARQEPSLVSKRNSHRDP